MNTYLRTLQALALSLSLASCTQILTATNNAPIQEDPGSRSLGSYIDDQIIETKHEEIENQSYAINNLSNGIMKVKE